MKYIITPIEETMFLEDVFQLDKLVYEKIDQSPLAIEQSRYQKKQSIICIVV